MTSQKTEDICLSPPLKTHIQISFIFQDNGCVLAIRHFSFQNGRSTKGQIMVKIQISQNDRTYILRSTTNVSNFSKFSTTNG